MMYFCPECWDEIGENHQMCPHCGADLLAISDESFVHKLMRALRHPEPQTPIRAAYILGALNASQAIPALMDVATKGTDPYIRSAAIEALGKFHDPRVIEFLKALGATSLTVVERAAFMKALPSHGKGERGN